MPRRSRLSLAKADIVRTFEEASLRVFKRKDIGTILGRNRHDWKLANSTSLTQFLDYVIDKMPMRVVKLESESYASVTRYVWGVDVSNYELFLSVKNNAYLSHATSIFLHGLSDLIPKMVYVNAEQSPKPAGRGALTQDALTRAFSSKQRTSRLVYTVGDRSATFLSGKNTGNLGAIEIEDPESGRQIRVTDLERTLIDSAVRPNYAGGVSNVLDAFRGARDRVSTNRLRAYLKRMNYVYPYNQSIGFLMSRAGYPEASLKVMRDLGLEFDFYLDYAMAEPDFDSAWRVYFPKGL